MRLIDADNLLAYIKEDAKLVASCGEEHTADDIVSIIMTAPTIDAEPVRHGRWERRYKNYWAHSSCACLSPHETNYCHRCGAKMDLKED